MNKFARLLLGLYLVSILSCTSSKEMTTDKSDRSLFHIDDDHWSSSGDATWNIKEGILTGQGGLSYASTEEQFGDFILEAEFKPDKIINSGIFIRCPEKTGTAGDCYEINISDNHENQDFRSGAIVTHGKPLSKVNTIGKWNNYKIIAQKDHIEVWLNNTKTADLKDSKTSEGYIVLQVFDKGVIQFRNIRIRKL